MDPSERIELTLFVFCIILNALYSAAETALVSIRRGWLDTQADEGRTAARLAQRVLDNADRYFASVQFAITTCTMVGAASATLLIAHWFELSSSLGRLALAVAGAGILFLLFAELIPKTLARRNSESVALFLVRPVQWTALLLFPIIQVLIVLSNGILRLVPGLQPLRRNPYVTEEEIKVLVEKGEEMGELEEDEREMVTAIFDLDRRVVREVMIPRVDVVHVEARMTLDEAVDAIISSGHTRVPVCEGGLDHVVGILHAKDLLLPAVRHTSPFHIRAVMRPGFFVPENKNAKVLLEEMRARRTPFAIVVDEYGGTAGVITIEDLIEEIVGEIRDEYDVEEDPILLLGEDVALVDGRAPVEDVNEELDIEVESEEYDSIGGFVVGLLGRVPSVGDQVDWKNVRFVVDDVGGNRARRVRILVDRAQQDAVNGNGE